MPLRWDTLEHGHGLYHTAEPAGDRDSRPDVLVVYVHGINSNAASWGDAPDRLVDFLKTDINILNFNYPACFFHRTSFTQAAADLLATIEAWFPRVDHLVFVCHSAGGIVVKDLIVKQWKGQEKAILQAHEKLVTSKLIRIRNIFNIAVPHLGGKLLPSNLNWMASLALTPLTKLFYWGHVIGTHLKQLRALTWVHAPGRNQITACLRYMDGYLKKLEEDYLEAIRTLDEHGYPRPVALDYVAAADEVVPVYRQVEPSNLQQVDESSEDVLYRSDAAYLTVRGTHTSARNEITYRHIDQKIARLLEMNARPSSTGSAVRRVIADAALNWCQYLDHQQREVRQLYDDPDRPLKLDERGRYVGCQRAVLGRISADVMGGRLAGRMAILTGASGNGKSVVLRCLVRRFAIRWLLQENPDGPIAVGVPLQEFRLSKDDRATFGEAGTAAARQQVFLNWWTTWANDVLTTLSNLSAPSATQPPAKAPGSLSSGDLQSLLAEGPIVFVLDSIDEFMANNFLGDEEAWRLIEAIRTTAGSNPLFTVILGARSGSPATRMALDLGVPCYEVTTLSPAAAEARYPKYGGLLNKAEDREATAFLLTPQILERLGPLAGNAVGDRLVRPQISEMAFDTFMDPGKVQGVGKAGLDACKDALAVLAWSAMVDAGHDDPPRGEAELDDPGRSEAPHQEQLTAGRSDVVDVRVREEKLSERVERIKHRWRSYLAASSAGEVSERVRRCFEVLSSKESLHALLHHSVFVSVGLDAFRFEHQEWLDYATARYLSLSILSGNIVELGRRTFSPVIFRHVGWQLRATELTVGLTDAVLQRTAETGNQFIIGNFAASLGYWRPVIAEDSAVDLLLRYASGPGARKHARHVLLTTLGVLALQPEASYGSAGLVRGKIVPAYRDMLGAPDKLNPVTESVVWCYWRALSKRDTGAGAAADPAWPRLDSADNCRDDGLDLACPRGEDGGRDMVRERSIQYGYAETARLMLRDATRTIASIHYLYPAAVAVAAGKSYSEVRLSLAEFLREGDPVGAVPSVAALTEKLKENVPAENDRFSLDVLLPEPGRELESVLSVCVKLCRASAGIAAAPSERAA